MEVRVSENGLERALKLLKRTLQREGLMGELKRRRYYDKPSVRLKNKKREAQKRRAKNARHSAQSRKR
ncbi:MAG: 30S ribosomal protein S21 [Nitrospirota bacterium]